MLLISINESLVHDLLLKTCVFSSPEDSQAPTISGCPVDITEISDSGYSVNITWTPPTTNDNYGMVTFTSDYNPGDWFVIGTTTVTYTATDTSGNTATCSFNVTILGGMYEVIFPTMENREHGVLLIFGYDRYSYLLTNRKLMIYFLRGVSFLLP